MISNPWQEPYSLKPSVFLSSTAVCCSKSYTFVSDQSRPLLQEVFSCSENTHALYGCKVSCFCCFSRRPFELNP